VRYRGRRRASATRLCPICAVGETSRETSVNVQHDLYVSSGWTTCAIASFSRGHDAVAHQPTAR
jgi:hypothetical protein